MNARAYILAREVFRRTTCLPTSGRRAPTYVIAASESVVLFEGVEGVRCQSVIIYFLASLWRPQYGGDVTVRHVMTFTHIHWVGLFPGKFCSDGLYLSWIFLYSVRQDDALTMLVRQGIR